MLEGGLGRFMSEWMTGKHAVITGASSGIGLELAKNLNGKCRKLSLVSRTMTEMLNKIPVHSSTEVHFWDADICNIDKIKLLMKDIYKDDQVDAFINAAGGTDVIELFENMTPEQISYTIDVNLIAPLMWLHELLPRMSKNTMIEGDLKKAHILMMSSRSAERSLPTLSVYAAAKMGVDRCIEALQREYAQHKIVFTLIHPGSINTNFTAKWPEAERNHHNEEAMSVEEAVLPILLALNTQYATNNVSYESVKQWTRELGVIKKDREEGHPYGLRS